MVGEGVRPHDGTKAVVGIGNAAGPFAHGLADGILQGGGAGGNGHDLRAQQPHFVYVQRLALGILLTHKDNTFHAHQGGGSGGGYAVLACTGLGNQAGLAHLLASRAWPSTLLILWAPVWFKSSRLR